MKVSRLQAILAIIVVMVFTLVTATIALAPVIGGFPADTYLEHLKSFSSIYGGIVGIIIGYFFGKQSAEVRATEK